MGSTMKMNFSVPVADIPVDDGTVLPAQSEHSPVPNAPAARSLGTSGNQKGNF